MPAADWDLKMVCSWRITNADPSGMMMWFDPTCEEPLLRSLPTEQRSMESEDGSESAAGTLGEVGGVPCEGSAAEETDRELGGQGDLLPDLPF